MVSLGLALDHGRGEFDIAQGGAVFRAEKSDGVEIRAPSHPVPSPPESPRAPLPAAGALSVPAAQGQDNLQQHERGDGSVFGVPRTTLAPRTSTHARARGAGGGARRCGGRTGSRCEGETPSRWRPVPTRRERGKKKDDVVFRGRAGAPMEYAKGGDVPACEHGDVPFQRDRESHAPRDPFLVAAYHSSAPRAAGGAAQRCASTRAHSPAPAPPRDPTNAFGWRARTPPPLRRARFFSPLRPAGASSVTELRRKQVHSAEVGSARPDPKRGNRCERRAFRNATPPRPGQDSATPRTRTHLRLGGTGSVA